ncbi:HD domain-containing phosphohydrolase [Nitrospira sp. BLG_1]|uniref:HD domain-containing phosphohydrolase n=1 Tax=Nitrospira sp. BLG_1 TaxID=3395883 RepID=UPI0039BD3549
MTTSAPSPTRPTILIIDDEVGPRDALKVVLGPSCTIHCAENARTALELLRQQSIDLITLDQKLPDRPGLELLQEIKLNYPDIEVVIVTGYGSLKSAMEGIRHGAAGYLLKPFNTHELTTLIQQTIEKKRRLDFLRRYLRNSPELWRSPEQSTHAWQTLQADYFSLSPNHEPVAVISSQDEMRLLPLFSDILEATDRQLLNHSSRVSFYATLMAARLNLSLADQKALALGAFLHDIGKTSLPHYRFSDDQVLPSREPVLCREHPGNGARMIESLGLPAEVGQIIAAHHERWDGQGYPLGLQGAEIPRLARIVGMAQLFDHLTADAPGRSPLSMEQAIQRIADPSLMQFDPQLLELFIDVVKESTASIPTMTAVPAA